MRGFCIFICMLCHTMADSLVHFDNANATKTSDHPFVYGLGRVFFHYDNFIVLDKDEPKSEDVKPQTLKSLKPLKSSSQKPKVLLIMDDISTLEQIQKLEKLKLNVIPSLFPKTKHTAITPELAQDLEKKERAFMLHLPLEALQFAQSQLAPIKVGTQKSLLRQRLADIKADFPSLVYINNHTGSKFTQSYDDMRNLLEIFDELGLKFIDSVTIAQSASERIAKEQNRLIMARDVFLDNQTSVGYIKAQLKELIAKAKNKGYAIGICHPHNNTFKALHQMSSQLNASVELLSPQELESYLLGSETLHYVRAPFKP